MDEEDYLPDVGADTDLTGRPASGVVVGHLLANAGMGGAEVYAALLANAHAEQGGSSHVIVLGGPGPISGRFAPKVQVTYLNYQRASIRNPLQFAASIVKGFRLVAGTVRRQRIQVLQSHLPDTNLWGLALTLRGVCRVVITIHNNKFLGDLSRKSLRQSLKLYAYRLMARRCAAVVAVSGEVRTSLLTTLDLRGTVAKRVLVVDNGVPIPPPLSPAERDAVRRKHGVGQGDFWVVGAGRLTEAKNFQCLLEAARTVRQAGVPLRVLVAGEGHLRPRLEEQVADLGLSDIVALPGNIQDLGDVLQAADLLAMPSRWEGLPMVLLESLARGVPVVGTRIKGLADTVQDGVHGLLVEVDDAPALAAAMTRLYREPVTRLGMGRAGLALAEDRYDFARVYRELAAIYAKAVDDPAGRSRGSARSNTRKDGED